MQYKLTVTETGSRSSALLEKKNLLKLLALESGFVFGKKKKKRKPWEKNQRNC